MSDEIFGKFSVASCGAGRLFKPGVGGQPFRVRSGVQWVGLHWCGESVICGRGGCKLCESRLPARNYGFVYGDIAGGRGGLLQCTEADLAAWLEPTKGGDFDELLGRAFMVSRPVARRGLRFAPLNNPVMGGAVDAAWVALEVLTVHGVRCTAQEYAAGQAMRLVRERAAEFAAAGRRVTA